MTRPFIGSSKSTSCKREDLSLLLWTSRRGAVRDLREQPPPGAILARHPVAFGRRVQALIELDPETDHFTDITFEWANVVCGPHGGDPLAITSRGLRVKLLAMRDRSSDWPVWMALTRCHVLDAFTPPIRQVCISLKATKHWTNSDTISGSIPTVTRDNSTVVCCFADLGRFEWQEFYLAYRYEDERGPKRTLRWPPFGYISALREYFASCTLEVGLKSQNLPKWASPFPRESLDSLAGVAGTHSLRNVSPSHQRTATCCPYKLALLVLDIPVSTPKDYTPGFETVAITFGLTGAGSDSTQIPSASSPYVVGLFGATWSRFPQSPALARRWSSSSATWVTGRLLQSCPIPRISAATA